MAHTDPNRRGRLALRLSAVSWRDLLVIFLPVAIVMFVVAWGAVAIFRPAPPDRIRLISGPPGSIYRTNAEKYQTILQRYGVKVEILPSRGSLDNLQRLADPKFNVDVGLVQSGLTDGVNTAGLMSLGTLFTQPLMVYYRHAQPSTCWAS